MSEFVDYLKEIFAGLGSVSSRKMFGGHGIYHGGVMFGLVAHDTLYLKADKETAPEFEAKGLTQFEYSKGNKLVKMSYYLAPEEALENPDDAEYWARLAYAAALRAKSNK